MKVGDLVEIEKWCKNKGRRGIVVEAIEYMGCVKIRYLDTGAPSSALRDNLKVISESR
jgi:hypothetical protein